MEDLRKTFKLAEIAKEVNDDICTDIDFYVEETDPFEAVRDRMIDFRLHFFLWGFPQ